MRAAYDEKVWFASTGAIRVCSSGEGSKRVSRTRNWASCGREGREEIGGRVGAEDMVPSVVWSGLIWESK